jgi:hypothetical protein
VRVAAAQPRGPTTGPPKVVETFDCCLHLWISSISLVLICPSLSYHHARTFRRSKTSVCKALAQKLAVRLAHRYSSCSLIEINAHSLFSRWFSESGKLVSRLFAHIGELVEQGACRRVWSGGTAEVYGGRRAR